MLKFEAAPYEDWGYAVEVYRKKSTKEYIKNRVTVEHVRRYTEKEWGDVEGLEVEIVREIIARIVTSFDQNAKFSSVFSRYFAISATPGGAVDPRFSRIWVAEFSSRLKK